MQTNASSIQAEINNALAIIFQGKMETTASGRTDAGVHAKAQVFHCDLPKIIEEGTLCHKMNGVLPSDIIINKILSVGEKAHARFDAISRSYEYHVLFKKSPFGSNENYILPKKPDFDKMNEACQIIIGEDDFTSLSKVKTDVNNFVCDIKRAEWQYIDEKAVFYITANRFLRGMVRALVGTLLDVGFNKISPDEFTKIIEAKDRTHAGQSVPAQGLYLCDVRYPSDIFN